MRPLIRSKTKGQIFLEFALVLPLCLTILTAMIDMGLYLNRYVSIQTAVREAARAAAMGMTDEQVTAVVISASESSGLVAANVRVVRADADPEFANLDAGDGAPVAITSQLPRYQSVEIRVDTVHHYLVPVFSLGKSSTRIYVSLKTLRPLR